MQPRILAAESGHGCAPSEVRICFKFCLPHAAAAGQCHVCTHNEQVTP